MIQTRNLTVDLGGRPIIQGVSLHVHPGEVVGLIGPNGAGKTTVLRSVVRLLPLARGEVWLDGYEITKDAPHSHATKIAYLPQGQTIAWPLTGRRIVELGRAPHATSYRGLTAHDYEAVERAIQRCEAEAFVDKPINMLSGGERARVLLARALAVEGRFLLADEPLAALDPYHQLKTLEVLRTVAQAGCAVVVVLHDLGIANRICSRLYLMADGKVVAEGAPDAVLTDENLARVYRVGVRRSTQGDMLLSHRVN